MSVYSIPTTAKKLPKRKRGKDNNPLKYKDENLQWLARKWYSMNKNQSPNPSQLIKGIINFDKKHIQGMYPNYPQGRMNKIKE